MAAVWTRLQCWLPEFAKQIWSGYNLQWKALFDVVKYTFVNLLLKLYASIGFWTAARWEIRRSWDARDIISSRESPATIWTIELRDWANDVRKTSERAKVSCTMRVMYIPSNRIYFTAFPVEISAPNVKKMRLCDWSIKCPHEQNAALD